MGKTTKWIPEAAKFGGAIWYKVCRTLRDGTMEASGNYYRTKKDAQEYADKLNKEEPNGTIYRCAGDYGGER
ncbi:MAG: hypothetical protein IKE74_08965 [Mogibacterium sp.]|nr:hypothetical protein [Mogibacterium sp.]